MKLLSEGPYLRRAYIAILVPALIGTGCTSWPDFLRSPKPRASQSRSFALASAHDKCRLTLRTALIDRRVLDILSRSSQRVK